MNFAAHNRSGFSGLLDVFIGQVNFPYISAEQTNADDTQLTSLRSTIIQGVNKLEHLVFNVPDTDGGYLCPACGAKGDFDGCSFDMRGGVVGTVICRCCMYQPGFDDDQMASAGAQHTVTHSIMFYRKAWIKAGMPWRSPIIAPPPYWTGKLQLAHLYATAPYLPHD